MSDIIKAAIETLRDIAHDPDPINPAEVFAKRLPCAALLEPAALDYVLSVERLRPLALHCPPLWRKAAQDEALADRLAPGWRRAATDPLNQALGAAGWRVGCAPEVARLALARLRVQVGEGVRAEPPNADLWRYANASTGYLAKSMTEVLPGYTEPLIPMLPFTEDLHLSIGGPGVAPAFIGRTGADVLLRASRGEVEVVEWAAGALWSYHLATAGWIGWSLSIAESAWALNNPYSPTGINRIGARLCAMETAI